MKFLLISAVCLLGFTSQSQGNIDGFFKAKGELDVALSGSYVYARTYFAGVSPILYTRDQNIISAYGVYGISDKWNAVVSLPMINFKLQDATLFAKYKLADYTFEDGRFTMAPALGISFPVSNYNPESGQAIGQKAVIIQPKYVIQLHHRQNWFIQVQGGFNYAFNPVPSSAIASAKVGFIYKNWYFDLWYDFQYGIGGKDYGSGSSSPLNSFRELGVSYERGGGVIYASIGKRFGAFVGLSTVLSGRNISQANSYNAGIVIKFDTNKEE